MKRIVKLWRLLPLYVLVVGLTGWQIWASHQHYMAISQAVQQAQAHIAIAHVDTPVSTSSLLIEGRPVRVVIPRVGIDVQVVDGRYYASQKVWSVADSTANYAVNTPLINNKTGATLIYGHWTSAVFGQTSELQPGDTAYVFTDTNHVFSYRYSEKSVVDPTDIEVFTQLNDAPGLRLMTCEGTWAQHRRIMSFNLQEST